MKITDPEFIRERELLRETKKEMKLRMKAAAQARVISWQQYNTECTWINVDYVRARNELVKRYTTNQ